MLLLARTTPVDQVEQKTEGLSTFIVDMKRALADGTMTIRPIKTLMNHATTEIFLDGVVVPGRRPRRRGGAGLPLHPRRDERRAHPDRGRVHRRRPLVRREGEDVRVGAGRLRPPDRRQPGRPVPDRAGARRDRGRRPDALQGRLAVRAGPALRRRGEHGEAARRRRLVGGRERLSRHARRLRLRRGVRHRAQVPRDALYKVAPVSNNLILAYLGQHVLGMPRSY